MASSAAAASAAPTRQQALSLLRSLLRAARNFSDYNVREYAKRRTLDGFRHNAAVSDAASLSEVYSDGLAQLQVVQRQSTIYSLYKPKYKSIIEAEQQLKKNPIKV